MALFAGTTGGPNDSGNFDWECCDVTMLTSLFLELRLSLRARDKVGMQRTPAELFLCLGRRLGCRVGCRVGLQAYACMFFANNGGIESGPRGSKFHSSSRANEVSVFGTDTFNLGFGFS